MSLACGRTALLLACAHGHDAVVALLGAPTRAAGALDAIASSGFSALLWAEERGMDVVAQRLRELGAAAVRRPCAMRDDEPRKNKNTHTQRIRADKHTHTQTHGANTHL